ncbi:tyrocidine synthetase 1 [Nemania sp. FL0916]|nr:tyrocidine synthetase 1 [Nemania sp. FL0916]
MMVYHSDIIIDELCAVIKITREEVNLDASFVFLGGHSLTAIRWSSRCRQRGVNLLVDNIIRNTSILEIIESALPPGGESSRQSHRDAVGASSYQIDPFAWLDRIATTGVDFTLVEDDSFSYSSVDDDSSVRDDTTDTTEPSTVENLVESVLPAASDLQLSLIHGSVKHPGTNIIQHFETYRPEDIPAVNRAWKVVFGQESTLRLRFSNELLPCEHDHFPWEETVTSNEAQFDELVNSEPISTTIESSWKVITLANASEPAQLLKSVVVWTIHHALIDGYSAQLLLAKVRRASGGQHITPGPSSAELGNKIQDIRRQEKSEADAFWASQQDALSQAATAFQMPSPALTPVFDISVGECTRDITIPSEELASISRQRGITPATIFHAAWALVMTLFADNNTICFGITLSGRNLPLPGIDEAVGPFANTLPMALSSYSDMTLGDLAAYTFRRMAELSQYQWTTPENGFVRNFQSILAMQFDLSLNSDDDTSICPIEPPYTKQSSDVPLSVLIHDRNFVIRYNKHDFEQSQVDRIGDAYLRAIQSFTDLQKTLAEVRAELIPPEAYQLVRQYGNCLSHSTSPSFITDDLITLYEATVDKYPDCLALERGAMRLTYAELDSRVQLVAQTLSSKISPGEIVCLDADRSVNWIIAIFGVLKAEGVYCALAADLPDQIRAHNFETTGARIFLTSDSSTASRAPPGCLHLTTTSILSAQDPANSCKLPRRQTPSPWSTAYVCFTSGSTGKPKGVVCSHEGLVAFQNDLEVRLFAQPGVRISQLMSPAFDGSIHEIFSAICHGATLVLPAGDNVLQVLEMVTSAILTPSVADVLDPGCFPSLENVYLVGEQVKQVTNDRWGAAKKLYNMYGPTEGTCGATIKRLRPGYTVTIGRPNPTTRIYILNSERGLVPPGVIGEIYLAGVQVARGYLGNQTLTSQCFLPDSVSVDKNEYMYKTGDRGYWTSDGEIMCLGRTDRQIKLRGFRLDLDDLEARIAETIPGLKYVALAQREDFLVAAMQPSTLETASVAALVAKILPAYAQPRHILLVDKFPLTKAGKLDYAAISSDEFIKVSLDNSDLQTPTQAIVASIWRDLLKLDHSKHIGPKSNFLQLGGNSLLQMALLARLSSTLRIKTPLKVVIDYPCLGDLAAQLDKLRETEHPKLGGAQALGERMLSPVEQDWWARYRLDGLTTTTFNVSYVATLPADQSINLEILTAAWNAVLSRHSILRSRYVSRRENCVERHIAALAPRVQRVQHLNVWTEVNRPFDLARAAPIRVALSPDTLAIVLSHIVADLTTLRIILHEVETLYHGHDLPPLRYTYENNVKWGDETPFCHLKFWSEYLDGYDISVSQSFSHRSEPIPERESYCGRSFVYRLPDDLAATTRVFIQEQMNISPQQLALAVVALALQSDTNTTDIVLGSPFMNRSSEADMEIVGLFLEPLPVRIRYEPSCDDVDAKPYLDSVRSSAKTALGHAVPWHKLLEHLGIEPQHPNHAIFNVMVTFHEHGNAISLGIPGVRPQLTWSEGSKFSIMVEFTALESGGIIMRIEHDSDQHTSSSINRLAATIAKTLSLLAQGKSNTTIKQVLRDGDVEILVPEPDAFGALLERF